MQTRPSLKAWKGFAATLLHDGLFTIPQLEHAGASMLGVQQASRSLSFCTVSYPLAATTVCDKWGDTAVQAPPCVVDNRVEKPVIGFLGIKERGCSTQWSQLMTLVVGPYTAAFTNSERAGCLGSVKEQAAQPCFYGTEGTSAAIS